jgi:hypothetical protein
MNKTEIAARLEEIAKEQEDLRLELEFLAQQEANPWPRELVTYIHGEPLWGDSGFVEFIREAGWEEKSGKAQGLINCNYEHELTYSVSKSGKATLIRVDGRELLPK